eukprot:CAMPEP_0115029820 /NCGR_PEP_ID=MMETSP0216-20121206/37287_1 /TAXON_ID=223996 /ORGANISM="Protocruzia adherens, Strain Boccale" /LENGTH=152 /DNA_ID=CAMNT_0002406595 /DNA_START=168 /DNA_END=626 /DNA_ORIENTATION=+
MASFDREIHLEKIISEKLDIPDHFSDDHQQDLSAQSSQLQADGELRNILDEIQTSIGDIEYGDFHQELSLDIIAEEYQSEVNETMVNSSVLRTSLNRSQNPMASDSFFSELDSLTNDSINDCQGLNGLISQVTVGDHLQSLDCGQIHESSSN